jgi:hypothetical protein
VSRRLSPSAIADDQPSPSAIADERPSHDDDGDGADVPARPAATAESRGRFVSAGALGPGGARLPRSETPTATLTGAPTATLTAIRAGGCSSCK